MKPIDQVPELPDVDADTPHIPEVQTPNLTQEPAVNFTQFLSDPHRQSKKPSFLQLVRHDALWPAKSNRLHDFEAFLAVRLEEEAEAAIDELRALWREYADGTQLTRAKNDLDLALARWGDYAAHLRTCSGSPAEPCEVAAELLERALEESSFDDLHLARPSPPCEGVEEDDEDEPPIGRTRRLGAGSDEDDDTDE